MNRLFQYTWPLLAFLVLAACKKNPEEVIPEDSFQTGKELIAFSQEGSGLTRAPLTRAGFAGDTKVVIRIKSQEEGTTNVRYTQAIATASAETTADDACNTSYGLEGTHSHLSYAPGQERYWDDAFGRASQLTVYAVAVPNKSDGTVPDNILSTNGSATAPVNTSINPNWYTITGTENTRVDWSVSAQQSAATRLAEDLAFSNNIREGETITRGRYHQSWDGSAWTPSMELGRMIWQQQTSGSTTGRFDQGHLVFKHSLSWLTLVLKEGAGFNNASNSDFVWTNLPAATAQTLTLTGFPTSGKLDVSDGNWSSTSSTPITQMDETTGTPTAITTRTLHAYVLPGTDLYNTTTNVIEFEIDNARYYVTGKQIAEAIRKYYNETDGPGKADPLAAEYRSFTTTKAGKNYIINLSVAKKGIDNVTAAILPWESVNSEDADPKNTYATFTFEDRSTRLGENDVHRFGIYRIAKTAADFITGTTEPNYDWSSGYNTDGAATKEWDTDHWWTTWFWFNNKTYYHFRAAGDNATGGGVALTTDSTDGDYFTLTSGASYKDYIWGAPFTYVDNSFKIKYDNPNGFSLKADGTTKQISQAIGATDSQIKMLLFHMTSQVSVIVKTTTDTYEVALEDGTDKSSVEILNFLPDGKVRMGTGAVSAHGTRDDAEAMTYLEYTPKNGTVPAQVSFFMGMVPQALTYPPSGTIGLRITTPDGNQYVVKDLSQCKATVSDTHLLNPYTVYEDPLYSIDAWYPHYLYTYTITLKKTGIQNITAAVLPWETISGDLGTIDLEN